MTIEDRCRKLNYLITCMKCEVSGKECNDNCPTQYLAGNMSEIIQNLEAISKELLKEPDTSYWITHECIDRTYIECSKCSSWFLRQYLTRNSYCPNCGRKMNAQSTREVAR